MRVECVNNVTLKFSGSITPLSDRNGISKSKIVIILSVVLGCRVAPFSERGCGSKNEAKIDKCCYTVSLINLFGAAYLGHAVL